ncbi:MAG: Fic family protein [Desulfobulbaceae bacterium]|jgi:Fic family protein|nr:Fic family protein [Desulfobulbaceae bacterium]
MEKNKQDIVAVVDQGESLGIVEPWRIAGDSRFREPLNDLAVRLAQKSAGFRQGLPQKIVSILASLVRGMNCYYSNLIEGHDTHPVDIERALNDDFSSNSSMRDLQLEAKAHIEVQRWIDNGGLQQPVTSVASLLEIHHRFCLLLPDDLLWAQSPQSDTPVRVVPGSLREHDVQVGRHIPISAGAVPRFLERFADTYSHIGQAEMIVCVAAAHHRLLWIHPFLDANGRVARLMSHTMLLQTLDTGSIWSVSRGLARNEQQYKSLLANCDQPRRNELDGRGNLSEEALVEFTRFFLETCLDQVAFMESLMQPDKLTSRILSWASESVRRGHLPKKSGRLLEAILFRGGELNRGEIPEILDVGTRQSRRVVSALIKEEVLVATSSRAPLILNFPARLAGLWMPGLFPEK